METLDMNANRLQTEERKIQWLENEIKELEYVLSSDCINRNNKLCQLQMYRELLAIKRELKMKCIGTSIQTAVTLRTLMSTRRKRSCARCKDSRKIMKNL